MSRTGMIRRRFRAPHADVVKIQLPLKLADKRMFDDNDWLIATFERAEEAAAVLSILNSQTVLVGAIAEAIRLIDDDVDNALDARIVLYSALRLADVAATSESTK